MDFTWKKKYQIGIEDIDLQHHYFLDLINKLSHELSISDDAHYMEKLLQELIAYVKFHFISEENFMEKHKYPDLENHRDMHYSLVDNLTNYLSSENMGELLKFLNKWFISHTTVEDMKFGEYYFNTTSRNCGTP